MRQRNVAVTPAGRGEAVKLLTALVHRTVMAMATVMPHSRHLHVNVPMTGWVTRVTYSVFMVTNNLLTVTTVCVMLVGRLLNATWSVQCTAMSTTTCASATLAGEGICATSQGALVSLYQSQKLNETQKVYHKIQN